MKKGAMGSDKICFVCLVLGIILVSVFVLAASAVPTDLTFGQNTTPQYDKEGNFTVNWTAGGGGDEVNYTIWLSIDGGASWFASADNDSATGYVFSNVTDANYTFKVQAINNTLDDANSSLISMVVDTTSPLINTAHPTNTSYATAPTNFNYTYTEANCDKVWYSNNSGVTNSSVENCGTNFTSMVVGEGSNTWIVYVNDSAGNENSSVVYFTFDETDPVASASCSPSSGIAGSVTCTCSGTDTGGSGIDLSLTTPSSTPSTTGMYTCNVTDNAGNTDGDTDNYTITASSSSTTFVPIYRPSESKLAEGYDISLGENYEVQFQISEQSHTLKVDSVSTTSATITISSEPITLELNLSETKKVDLDSDGYYDLSVYLKEIKFSKANFILTSINEEVVNGDSVVQDGGVGDEEVIQDSNDSVEADEESNYIVWIILVIVLVIGLVVLGVIYVKKFRE